MAQTSTSTTNFNQTVVALVQKKIEEELRAPLPHLLPGNFVPSKFVKGTNNTMRFIRYGDATAVAGTPSPGTPPWLNEGVAPTPEELSIGYEEYSANQAGRTWKLTDIAMMESPHDLLAVAAGVVARNAVETADTRVAEVLLAGANVMYQNGVARALLSDADILTGATVKEAVARMKEANIPTFGDGTYRAIVRPSSTFALESDTAVGGWIDAQRYAGSAGLFSGEVGRYAGVRFIESSKAAQVPASATVGAGEATITLSNPSAAADDIIDTATAHGFKVNEKIVFPTLTGGTGASTNTVYYVIAANLAAQTFQFSATRGGAAVNFTTDITAGTVRKVVDVNSTFLFGPGAYAFGDWGEIQTYLTQPGGRGDELHQSAIIGWKGFFGAKLLEAAGSRYLRIESANTVY